jgi:hypothetical protein
MLAEGDWTGRESRIKELDFLSWPGHLWMYDHVPLAINLGHLRYLAINQCKDLDVVLNMFTKETAQSGAALRGFVCEVHEDSYQSQTIDAVEKFLESFSCLEYIQVLGHWEEMFDFDCLKNHSSTLKHIYIGADECNTPCDADAGGQGWMPMVGQLNVPFDQFSALVARTPGLQQIALALPTEPEDLEEFEDFLARTSVSLK